MEATYIDRPLNDYILVEMGMKEEITEHGIFLPEAMRALGREGIVLDISKDLKTKLKAGDRVLYRSGSAIKTSAVEGERKILMSYFDLMMNLDTHTPLCGYILLKPKKLEEINKDGLFLTDEMREVSGIGEVLAVSSDIENSSLEVGETVMHRKESERESDSENVGLEYLLLYKNIMAVID